MLFRSDDAKLLCKGLSDIDIADDLAVFSNQKGQADGDARKLIKSIRLYEEVASKLSLNALNLQTYQKVVTA